MPNAIERLREAAEGWPQPNVYDDAVAAVDALYQAAKKAEHFWDEDDRDSLDSAMLSLAAAVHRVEGQAQVSESFDLSADEDWGEA